MAKKIEMSKEEQILFNELQKLVKKANQRLLRLERLTGEKGTFASKQLYDYLGINELKAITKTNRIRLSKSYNIGQLRAIKKATEKFLQEKTSRVSEVKKLTKEYSTLAGKELSFKQADVLYKSSKNYSWIYEYIPKSEFWGYWVPIVQRENWDLVTFNEQVMLRINTELDDELKRDLESLYYYIME